MKLVIIDTLSGFIPKGEIKGFNAFSDHNMMNDLQQLALKMNIAILVLHHTRKADSLNPTDKASGTKGITSPGEGTWLLDRTRTSNEGKLTTISRNHENHSYKLKLNADTLEWEYIGEKIELGITPERKDIIKVFLDNPNQELQSSHIASVLGKTQTTVTKVIKKLINKGVLVKGSKYSYYKLSDDYEGRLTKDNI